MLAIKLPSIQRYTRVDFMPADTKNTCMVIAYDFKNLTKEEKESTAISHLMTRLTEETRRFVLDNSFRIRQLSLKWIVQGIKENVRGVILNLLYYAQTDHKDPQFADELTVELALLERFDMMNSVFVTFSLDESNDTLIIHDSFQNGQQMLELTQTTQGLLHQIDIKRASFSNQGDLLLSVTYQKED